MGKLELLMEEWNRINDEVKAQRSERERFRNDNATQTALQQRIATLQDWMNLQGYDLNIEASIENQFNEFEFNHLDTIKNLQDQIEAITGIRPHLGE